MALRARRRVVGGLQHRRPGHRLLRAAAWKGAQPVLDAGCGDRSAAGAVASGGRSMSTVATPLPTWSPTAAERAPAVKASSRAPPRPAASRARPPRRYRSIVVLRRPSAWAAPGRRTRRRLSACTPRSSRAGHSYSTTRRRTRTLRTWAQLGEPGRDEVPHPTGSRPSSSGAAPKTAASTALRSPHPRARSARPSRCSSSSMPSKRVGGEVVAE